MLLDGFGVLGRETDDDPVAQLQPRLAAQLVQLPDQIQDARGTGDDPITVGTRRPLLDLEETFEFGLPESKGERLESFPFPSLLAREIVRSTLRERAGLKGVVDG